MTDIAELGFRVDSAQVLTATEALDRMGDQASQTERQLKQSTTAGTRGFREMNAPITRASSSMLAAAGAADVMGHSMRASGAHTTNLMFQFQDIGMMLAAGQSPLMLAMQQGTQVAGVFQQMKNSGQSAFSGIVGGLTSMINPMSLLTIGTIAGGAALAQWAMSALDAGESADEFADAISDLKNEIKDAELELFKLQRGLDSMSQAAVQRELERMEAELTTIISQIEGLEQVLSRSGNAPQLEGVLAGLREQRVILEENVAEARNQVEAFSDITDAIERAKDVGVDLSGVFDAMDLSHVIAQAGSLAQNLWNATAAARAVMQQAVAGRLAEQEAMRYSGRGGDPRQFDTEGRFGDQYIPSPGAVAGAIAMSRPSRGGGGGGGAARVSDEVLESQRAAARIMRDVERATLDAMSAAERYNHELDEVKGLHEEGYLTAEQYARAVDMIDQEFQEASFEQFRAGIESISDAIADAIVNGEDMGEAFSRVLKQIASDILSSGINDLLSDLFRPAGGGGGGIFGALFGGLFGGAKSFSGGGYTGDGPRSGGLDGQGGFLAMVHPRETVVDHTKGGSAGDVHIHHNWNIAANGDDSVKRIVQQQAPAIVEASKNAVLDAKRRGGSYGQSF